jgi:hypothetical protein
MDGLIFPKGRFLFLQMAFFFYSKGQYLEAQAIVSSILSIFLPAYNKGASYKETELLTEINSAKKRSLQLYPFLSPMTTPPTMTVVFILIIFLMLYEITQKILKLII